MFGSLFDADPLANYFPMIIAFTLIRSGDYKDLATQFALANAGEFETLRAAWALRGASKAEIAKRLNVAAKVLPHCCG
jgi:hypothetical protein